MEQVFQTYFEACNEASRDKYYLVLADDVIHYFPPQVGGPDRGKEALANLWIKFVTEKGLQWTIDRLVCDGHEVAIEWAHFKTKVGEHIRGAEWYEFDSAGKITEIRAYYAVQHDANAQACRMVCGFARCAWRRILQDVHPVQAQGVERLSPLGLAVGIGQLSRGKWITTSPYSNWIAVGAEVGHTVPAETNMLVREHANA